MSRFSWLHLTDLHFGQSGQGHLLHNVKERFFEDLKTLHGRTGPWDVVLFSGDFVQRGNRDFLKRGAFRGVACGQFLSKRVQSLVS